MIEEPYRWVEAIANRREYIETQLAGGSPVIAVSCRDGIVIAALGSTRRKVFEIYDRIAMGALGHPGDIERLRMNAIELASTEGFARSAADVSLRRLVFYSLSPALKAAFEQVYGAPFLARMLFAEVGVTPAEDLFLRVDYDGSIFGDANERTQSSRTFCCIAATTAAEEALNAEIGSRDFTAAGFSDVIGAVRELAAKTGTATTHGIEAAILGRAGTATIRYRQLAVDELEPLAAASP